MRRSPKKNTKQKKSAFSAAAAPPTEGQSDSARFLKSLEDSEIIERIRTTIKNAHVFKLPPRQAASIGWRGADWKEKVWQGTVKVVERGDITAVLLVDRTNGTIFAVCPIKEGAVDRCVDSSRYFVLRIENANGRHMFIGVAFNERNDAFDFNTALEDARRERELEKNPIKPFTGPSKDYSIKEGEKIHVSIPRTGGGTTTHKKSTTKKEKGGGSFLRPADHDTPSRAVAANDQHQPNTLAQLTTSATAAVADASAGCLDAFFSDANFDEPFPSTSFGDSNAFENFAPEDQFTESGDPFFKQSGTNGSEVFDPRNYQTESGR